MTNPVDTSAAAVEAMVKQTKDRQRFIMEGPRFLMMKIEQMARVLTALAAERDEAVQRAEKMREALEDALAHLDALKHLAPNSNIATLIHVSIANGSKALAAIGEADDELERTVKAVERLFQTEAGRMKLARAVQKGMLEAAEIADSLQPTRYETAYCAGLDTGQRVPVAPSAKSAATAIRAAAAAIGEAQSDPVPSHLISVPGEQFKDVKIADLIRSMSLNLKDHEFARIDALLEHMDPSYLPIEIIITLLRTPFPVRTLLPHWNSFLEKARQAIKERDRDPDNLLRGLEPVPSQSHPSPAAEEK